MELCSMCRCGMCKRSCGYFCGKQSWYWGRYRYQSTRCVSGRWLWNWGPPGPIPADESIKAPMRATPGCQGLLLGIAVAVDVVIRPAALGVTSTPDMERDAAFFSVGQFRKFNVFGLGSASDSPGIYALHVTPRAKARIKCVITERHANIPYTW